MTIKPVSVPSFDFQKRASWQVGRYYFETYEEARALARIRHEKVRSSEQKPTHRYIGGNIEPLVKGDEAPPAA